MQRFGTSTVPTHVTGLHILRSNWAEAITSILSLREGEHPDCLRARLHWLEDEDYEKALEVMPRRSVAERAIWEFWKRTGKTTDKLGALGSVRLLVWKVDEAKARADTAESEDDVRSCVSELSVELGGFGADQAVCDRAVSRGSRL